MVRLWALGWKGWVEVRKARVAPKARPSQVEVSLADPPIYAYNYYSAPRKITLKQLCFSGGKFLISFPKRRFYNLFRLSVPIGGVIEVPPPLVPKLLGVLNGQPHSHETALQTPHARPTGAAEGANPPEGAPPPHENA